MIRKEQQRFSLRKYKVGVASVFLGTTLSFMMANGATALASELSAQPVTEEKTELVNTGDSSGELSNKDVETTEVVAEAKEEVAESQPTETTNVAEGQAAPEVKEEIKPETTEVKSEAATSEKPAPETIKASETKEEEKPAAVVQPKVEEVQTVVETKVNEIKEHFNAAEFEKKKAELSEASKAVLMDLVKLLNENPSVKLQLEGHTSAEGDDNFNKKLSTSRAKAAVDFLVANGIDSSRLSYSGLGSSQLKNTANPEADENRRVEFIVIK